MNWFESGSKTAASTTCFLRKWKANGLAECLDVLSAYGDRTLVVETILRKMTTRLQEYYPSRSVDESNYAADRIALVDRARKRLAEALSGPENDLLNFTEPPPPPSSRNQDSSTRRMRSNGKQTDAVTEASSEVHEAQRRSRRKAKAVRVAHEEPPEGEEVQARVQDS